MVKIENSVISKVGTDLAKEYADTSNYYKLIWELWRGGKPYDAVEEYLIDEGQLDSDHKLKDCISASDYIEMMKVAQDNREEKLVAINFEDNFNYWFCDELREQLQHYCINLDAPVDVEAMARMAEYEKNRN